MSLDERLTKLQRQFRNMRVIGGEGVSVEGSTKHGFAVNIMPNVSGVGVGDGGGGGDVPGCTDPSACNFDSGATVDDASCTYGGACCVGTDCTIGCEADCAGIYQGDDTECEPNPCACPEVTLVCDQVSKSLSKCGNPGFLSSGLFYLIYNQVWNVSSSFTSTEEDCNPSTNCCECDYSDFHGFQFDYDPLTCISVGTGCFGTITRLADAGCPSGGTIEETWSFDEDGVCRSHPDSVYPSGCPGDCITGGTVIDSDTHAVTQCSNDQSSFIIDELLSHEYTTAELISNVVTALPTYDSDFNDACQAERALEEDESGYSVSRFKPKFTFAVAVANFTINYNEHLEPDGIDTPKSVDVFIGDTEVIGAEVLEPTANGIITITDIVVDCS